MASQYRKVVMKRFIVAGAILLMIIFSLLLDFTLGPSGISVTTLWHTLFDAASADAGTRVIVWDLRLPFALMAVVVGMALGLAGAEMQTILNNPLASPFTLGGAGNYSRAGNPRYSRSMVYLRQRLCLCANGLLRARRHQPLDARRHLRRGAVWYRPGLHL
ncbi:Iron-uptake system permease protein FeuC [compost metagenome]